MTAQANLVKNPQNKSQKKEKISSTLALEFHPSLTIRTPRNARKNEGAISMTAVTLCPAGPAVDGGLGATFWLVRSFMIFASSTSNASLAEEVSATLAGQARFQQLCQRRRFSGLHAVSASVALRFLDNPRRCLAQVICDSSHNPGGFWNWPWLSQRETILRSPVASGQHFTRDTRRASSTPTRTWGPLLPVSRKA